MRMDWKWTVLAVVMVLALLLPGCAKKQPEPTPPPPPPPRVEEPPPTDVDAGPKTADVVDETPQREPSLDELQADLERQGLLGDVFFAFDKYDLRPDARERLEKNAQFMQGEEGRSLTFTIEGHCDERGTNEYNLALGQRRSTTALDFLAEVGVARARFKTISYGEEKPFCTESNEACWQKNRRARFVVTGRSGG